MMAMAPPPLNHAASPNAPHSAAASNCHFHSCSWSSSSGITTLRGMILGKGRSRQRQNLGAVGQVIRAIVVELGSCCTVKLLDNSGGNGVGQVEQSPDPSSNPQ